MQKAKEKYDNCGGKEEAGEYYQAKKVKKEYSKNKYKEMKKKMHIYCYRIKMSEQTLKFDHIVFNEKEFHASKQAIALDLVESNRTLVSDKLKHNENGFKHFIGYLHVDDVIRPLRIILPPMSGYIKYFDNGGKNMSFLIEDEDVYLKYTEIWKGVKLGVKLHSQPIYYDKYIKTKVKTFNRMINIPFSDNEIPKERNHYICIAAICVDSVLKTDKKNYPQVYLEQCKCKIKKRELVNFIDDDLS